MSNEEGWKDRPAIVWNHIGQGEHNNDRTRTNDCYWSREILDLFLPLKDLDDGEDVTAKSNNNNEEEENTPSQYEGDKDFFSIIEEDYRQKDNFPGEKTTSDESSSCSVVSYETLMLLAAGVVREIRELYAEKARDDEQPDKSCCVIAVTLPEGPLLPLSVLVVHALNVGFEHHQQAPYAAMVPIDLDEGFERNRLIWKDANPSFVLATDRNSETVRQLVKDTPSSAATRILDVAELAKAARQNLSRLSNYCQLIGGTEITCSDTLQNLVSGLANRIDSLLSPDPSTRNGFETQYHTEQASPMGSISKISHIVYTSGTTGRPKGCVCSISSLQHYITAKNRAHDIDESSTVLLASALSFDPCLSDVLATFAAKASLAIAPRTELYSDPYRVVQILKVTHVLCTPTLWNLTLLHRPKESPITDGFPHLRRIALGGEPIPKSLVQAWARSYPVGETNEIGNLNDSCRLLATYGVTEACVYQTCGEVFRGGPASVASPGQSVGHALEGTGIRICRENVQKGTLVDVPEMGITGEIVLWGAQIDAVTSYRNRPELDEKFVAEPVAQGSDLETTTRYHYRTGDRGFLDSHDGSLTILGRIVGEEGMIKINGVRVELGEIEAALLCGESATDQLSCIVTDCLVTYTKEKENQSSTIRAYCVFCESVWNELGISNRAQAGDNKGFIINGGPLWTLLRVKCSRRLRKACIPSAFVGIQRLPLSRTGKRDRSGLPGLECCSVLDISSEMSTPLKDYGMAGSAVFDTVVQCLNLQPCQQKMVTQSASFAMLGGDSLSAVVVCRTLYAHFHRLQNSRHLGGEYGQLPEPFNAASLLRAKNLGGFVNLVDECISANNLQQESGIKATSQSSAPKADTSEIALLYDALLQATTLGQSSIAAALLLLGANPNYGHNHGSRIGNTSGRMQRRETFKSAPLHLASFRGDTFLVRVLLDSKASYKSPNTNGLFPLHLAAGGLDDGIEGTPQEESRRLECIKLLLDAGCPLLMKDANKQSVLHAAARAGNVAILEYAIKEHQSNRYNGPVPLTQFLEFQDKWFRSAVHWAVLHGRVQALKFLLEKGSNPSPYKPRSNRQSSMIAETPLEICKRLHGISDKGIEMEDLLLAAIATEKIEQDFKVTC